MRDETRYESLSHTHVIQLARIGERQSEVNDVHRDVFMLVSNRRRRTVDAHNRATNINITPSFSVGDFVPVRRAVDNGTNGIFGVLAHVTFRNFMGISSTVSQPAMAELQNVQTAHEMYCTNVRCSASRYERKCYM